MLRHVLSFATAASLLTAASISVAASGQAKPRLKVEPAPYTSPTSGPVMFTAYCADCHGPEGKGNGHAAPALRTSPPDLTRIAASNGGSFPELKVVSAIEGHPNLADRTDMPAWSRVFRGLGDNQEAVIRTHLLMDYVASLQVK